MTKHCEKVCIISRVERLSRKNCYQKFQNYYLLTIFFVIYFYCKCCRTMPRRLLFICVKRSWCFYICNNEVWNNYISTGGNNLDSRIFMMKYLLYHNISRERKHTLETYYYNWKKRPAYISGFKTYLWYCHLQTLYLTKNTIFRPLPHLMHQRGSSSSDTFTSSEYLWRRSINFYRFSSGINGTIGKTGFGSRGSQIRVSWFWTWSIRIKESAVVGLEYLGVLDEYKQVKDLWY